MNFPPFILDEPGVYAIGHDLHGVYIGCSSKMLSRLKVHARKLRRGIHPNHRLQRAWDLSGGEGFTCAVIQVTKDTYAAERAWIEAFDAHESGFNLTSGGQKGFVCHDEVTRSKISASKLGDLNPAKRSGAAISAALRGGTQSPESNAKRSISLKGKQVGDANPAKRPEVRAKIAAAMRGKRTGPRPDHAASMKGRVKINNGVSEKSVRPEQLDAFLAQGWVRGKRK